MHRLIQVMSFLLIQLLNPYNTELYGRPNMSAHVLLNLLNELKNTSLINLINRSTNVRFFYNSDSFVKKLNCF